MVFCGGQWDTDRDDEYRRLLRSMDKLELRADCHAIDHILGSIDDLNGISGVQNTDLIFLKGLMDSPVMKSIVKMQERLEDNNGTLEAVGVGNVELVQEIHEHCQKSRNADAKELDRLLQDPHLKALVNAHDMVASKSYEPTDSLTASTVNTIPTNGLPPDAIKMVGLRKVPGEPLGVTVRIENGELVIARILGGGMIEKQGLLRVGDVIKEVNGEGVYTPEQLQDNLKKAQGSITLKVMPSFVEQQPLVQELSARRSKKKMATTPRTLRKIVATVSENLRVSPCFVKAHFSYDPKKDSLLPCPEIGLAFKQGEILQILNQQDPNWWQAKQMGSTGTAGLIPSQELEERRKAFVRPEFDCSSKTGMCGTRKAKKKKKQMYLTKYNADFDKAELSLYEEVARMPPFQRKTLVLIGPQGISRKALKMRLVGHDPDKFATVSPYTTRPPRDNEIDGKEYCFTTRTMMETDISDNKYLEYGEYNGHLYGMRLDSVRSVIRSGKMCVVDCNAQALKQLSSPEFMPFVAFIAAPGLERLRSNLLDRSSQGSRQLNTTFDRAVSIRQSTRRERTLESLASVYEDEDLKRLLDESNKLQKLYEKYIDLVVVNDDADLTFERIVKAVNALSSEPQWVPVSWVY